ncbi:hypothetical protein HAX54_031907 [Datura stramonium]|uniref:RRM domain-containing protein n=1 Tax=Datura stramonium TaxID=4076 RepID=A0ABS8V9W4_DATST|nr:hypothetical protein [Datura stramonium]
MQIPLLLTLLLLKLILSMTNKLRSKEPFLKDLLSQDFSLKKVFVGGIPTTMNEDEFKGFFSKYGKVTDCEIIRDHVSKRSRGSSGGMSGRFGDYGYGGGEFGGRYGDYGGGEFGNYRGDPSLGYSSRYGSYAGGFGGGAGGYGGGGLMSAYGRGAGYGGLWWLALVLVMNLVQALVMVDQEVYMEVGQAIVAAAVTIPMPGRFS